MILQSLLASISLLQVFGLVLVFKPDFELAHELVLLSSIHVQFEQVEPLLGEELSRNVFFRLLLEAFHDLFRDFELRKAW